MTTTWKSCRLQEKMIRGMLYEQRKRAERKAAVEAKHPVDPLQSLRMYGQPVKALFDTQQYNAVEAGEQLMPWQGHRDNMIDRFDGRALLDIIPVFDKQQQQREMYITDEEAEQEAELNYERFHNLVENAIRGVEGTAAVASVSTKLLQTASRQQRPPPKHTPQAPPPPQKPKPPGEFAAVGYAYPQGEGGTASEADNEKKPQTQPAHSRSPQPQSASPPNAGARKKELEEGKSESSDESDDVGSEEAKGTAAVLSLHEREVAAVASEYGIVHYSRFARHDAVEQQRTRVKRKNELALKEKQKGMSRKERRRERDKHRGADTWVPSSSSFSYDQAFSTFKSDTLNQTLQ
eukprot:TRINITY_DN7707_c0_g1_i1.p1 TRINITY_DN7707_c0_g1~~TRINITY_DN7707_c0_g1_i1.p1  ORF type:complete len:358 (-),score=110.36 TRINITY_DN7707_c0_g1_i1:1618-2664(-)